MPSGRTHDRITVLSVPFVLGISYFVTQSGQLSVILTVGFLFSGLMFGPDLDIYSVQYKRWGWFRWLWIPYRSAIRHRSSLSHGFLIGTILRLAYLSVIMMSLSGIIAAIAYLLGYFKFQGILWLKTHLSFSYQKYWQIILALIIGLELGAMSHSLSDWIGSAYKRKQSQKIRSKSANTRSRLTSPKSSKTNQKRKIKGQ